jgi:hypothetical protein
LTFLLIDSLNNYLILLIKSICLKIKVNINNQTRNLKYFMPIDHHSKLGIKKIKCIINQIKYKIKYNNLHKINIQAINNFKALGAMMEANQFLDQN